MLLSEHMKETVEIYCDLMDIRMINGKIPQRYVRQVEDFISGKLKQDRKHTRIKEEENKLVIGDNISNIMKTFTESPIEEFMYMAIIREGIDKYCQPQYKIGTKRVDFAFPDYMLAVECDGKEYHHTDQIQIEKDQKRDKYLSKKGWRVLHFEGLVIRRNIDLCIDKIKQNIGVGI